MKETKKRGRANEILRLFMAAKIQVEVFWVVTPCSVVVGYRRFGDHPEDGGSRLTLYDITAHKSST